MFEKQSIDIVCAKCQAKHTKKTSWVKSHNQFTCSCGAIVKVDSKELHEKVSGRASRSRKPF